MTAPSRTRRRLVVLGLALTAAIAGCATRPAATTPIDTTTVSAGAGGGGTLGGENASVAPGGDEISTAPAGDAGAAAMAWEPVVIDASVPVGPENECAGVNQTTTDFTRLTADDQVSEIVVCGAGVGYLPGDGTWNLTTEHRVPAAQLPALVDGLRRPDVVLPPDTACTMILVLVPTFVVITAEGERRKGSVPSDGCHPQEDVVALINRVIAEQPADERWRTTRSQTEAELTSSCPEETAAVAWPPASVPNGTDGVPPQVPAQMPTDSPGNSAGDSTGAGAVVCLYAAPATADTSGRAPVSPAPPAPDGGREQEPEAAESPGFAAPATAPLLGTGRIEAALRDRLVASIVPAAPTDRPSCSATDPWSSADGSGQLLLATPPTRTAAGVPQPGYPYLVLETGRCARVLVDGGYTLAGWADPEPVTQVRAAVAG